MKKFLLAMLMLIVGAFALPTASFAWQGSSAYNCGNGGEFPMTFAGCRPGYYYEDWQNADGSMTPDEVGECLECPNGLYCAGGFAGPRSLTPYEYDGGGSMYNCGVGYFPMTFAGCRPGYYYEDWQNADVTLHPDEVGECLECPNGATCAGGFAGPEGEIACAANQIGVAGTCQTEKFSVTTTNNTTEFGFYLSAKGTFYIDWGDGTTETIARTNNTDYTKYEHEYASAGAYVVRFGGTATGYNADGTPTIIFNEEEACYDECDGNWAPNIASISGSLSALFPMLGTADGRHPKFEGTFSEATNLTTIPGTLFSGYTTGANHMFSSTFSDCTSLTTIPSNLFSGITTGANSMFNGTFYGCTSLTTIPSNLFSGITTGADYMFNSTFQECTSLTTIPDGLFSGITTGANYMFYSTFSGCTSLTTIPSNLFSGITTGAQAMFRYTFYGCTALTTIPSNLFSGITTGAERMFSGTFQNCTNLAGYIPPTTFAGLIANGHPTATNMWQDAFVGTKLATSCPANTTQYITGYEGSGATTWAGKVSCTCANGYYDDGTSCTTCANTKPANSSWVGGATTSTCAWACDAGYISDGTTCVACANTKPANSSWIGGATTSTCAWACDAGYISDGTSCIPAKFSVTTTTNGIAANDTFQFYISAKGTFYVDCGDGGVLSGTGASGTTITKGDTTNTLYACTYGTAGTKTIMFGGEADNYNTNTSTAAISFYKSSGGTQTKIASVSGNMSAVFPYKTGNTATGAQPRFYQTFFSASNLTDISGTLFSGYTTGASYMFQQTFYGCTSLTTIPSNLFSGITTGAQGMFRYTFYGCTSLTTIPSNLFGGITTGASNMFAYTFQNCTSLTTIPSNLFSGITTGASTMFSGTFQNCTSLTTIPDGLFSGITTGANYMFNSTFQNCTALTTIPDGLFSGITTSATYMFQSTFHGCTSLTTIPDGLFSGITTGANYMFYNTFYGCRALTTIPSNLFSGITTGADYMFNATFYGCRALTTIPSNLFSGITTGANYMFDNTFYGCTSLTTIPSNLFSGITTGATYMFYSTFYGCTALTTIPDGLFSGITTGASYMFDSTFQNCTNLAGYIPPTTFAGLIANGHPTATSMWQNAFVGTKLATSCPANTTQYITGYEGSGTTTWNGKVSCTETCPAGITTLRTSTGLIFPLFKDKLTTPALNIKFENNQICYANLEPGTASNTLNFKTPAGATYHAVPATTN